MEFLQSFLTRNHLITHVNLENLINGNVCATCHKVCRDRADAKRHVALKHKWLQLQLYIEYGIDYDYVKNIIDSVVQ